jgi:hypothetical protein
MKLIIVLIPTKHNTPKDLYQSKKIVADLGMNYEKIDVKGTVCCSARSTRTILNVYIVVSPDM